jgi:hypothetical protein
MTKWVLASCAVASLVACDNSTSGGYTAGAVVQPDAAVSVHIAPATLFIGTPGPRACPSGVFSPSFALVITPFGSRNMSIENATFRLIDGSTVGGPSVTFPQPQLTRMFGTLVVVGSRTFNFSPAFSCPVKWPRAMVADVGLNDGQRVTASVTLQ